MVHIVETMRPLPIDPIPGMPSFVRGLSVIRDAPVPVVDLAEVLEAGRAGTSTRFVLLKVEGDRRVALAVDRVIGLRQLDTATAEQMPPILRNANAGVIEAVGTLDEKLLLVLRATRVMPDALWDQLDVRKATP
jgi:purine-binding chemotaxis protein CheW